MQAKSSKKYWVFNVPDFPYYEVTEYFLK